MANAAALFFGHVGPAFISYGDGGGETAPNLVIADPAGGMSNDLVVAVYGSAGTAVTWTPASGFTEHLDQGAIPSLGVSSRVAGALGFQTFVSSSFDPANMVGLMLRFRLAAFDAIGSPQTVAADGALVIPAITSAGGLVLAAVVSEDNTAELTTPSGFDVLYNATPLGQRLAVFSKRFPEGSTGAVTTTVSGMSGTAVAGVLVGLA